jgi:hypothetical protein
MAEENIISSATEFLDKIRKEKEVTIKFVKKTTNQERTMKCTLDFNRIPLSDRPKDVNLSKILGLIRKHKILHVYDLEKQGWRSVPFDRVQWMVTPSDSKVYRIKAL